MLIQSLLFLRIKQIARAIHAAGIGLVILMLIISTGVVLQLLSNLLALPAYYSIGLASLIIILLHINRKDLLFLKSITSTKKIFSFILFTEYTLLITPIIIFKIFQYQFWIGAALFLPPALVALFSDFFKSPKTAFVKKNLSIFPLQAFELKTFIEKRKLSVFICYTISYLSFLHIAFFLISIFCCTALLLDAFKIIEPREMIAWHKNFLLSKLILNIKLFSILFTPPVLIALGMNWELKWIILYAFFYLFIMAFLAINYKYAHFSPLYNSIESANILIILLLLGMLPGGILISVGFGVYCYIVAKRKLTYYYA